MDAKYDGCAVVFTPKNFEPHVGDICILSYPTGNEQLRMECVRISREICEQWNCRAISLPDSLSFEFAESERKGVAIHPVSNGGDLETYDDGDDSEAGL